MHGTRNNCFGSKKCSTILCQARTVKHECRCCYISAFVVICYRLTKYLATLFPPETIVANFLHLMVVFFKVIFNYTSKRSLWCSISEFNVDIALLPTEILSLLLYSSSMKSRRLAPLTIDGSRDELILK